MNDEMKQFIKVFYRVLESPELKTAAEKLIYSIIYSFPNGKYTASLQWLMDKAGIGTKNTLIAYLNKMVAIGLLKKEKIGYRKVRYQILRAPAPKANEDDYDNAEIISFLYESGQF